MDTIRCPTNSSTTTIQPFDSPTVQVATTTITTIITPTTTITTIVPTIAAAVDVTIGAEMFVDMELSWNLC
jgi:hypothetical protein